MQLVSQDGKANRRPRTSELRVPLQDRARFSASPLGGGHRCLGQRVRGAVARDSVVQRPASPLPLPRRDSTTPAGSRIEPHLHQHMDGEIPANTGGHCEKSVNGRSSNIDVHDHVGFSDWVIRVVIRQVASALQLSERPPKIPQLLRKRGRYVLAARLGLPVLQRTIHPPPHRPVADGTSAASQAVRTGARQAMEHGVVCGAGGAAENSPSRPAGTGLGKVGGKLQKVVRLYDALLRLFVHFRFGGERDDRKRLHVRVLEFGMQAPLQPNKR